jgi:hypothetical protein
MTLANWLERSYGRDEVPFCRDLPLHHTVIVPDAWIFTSQMSVIERLGAIPKATNGFEVAVTFFAETFVTLRTVFRCDQRRPSVDSIISERD